MATEPYRWHYDYSRIAWDTGFYFNNQKTQKTFDRNGIALLDIERIVRERDIGIVEHHIQTILEYNLDNEEVRILDPNFVKLFRLSQLAVEYLIYCKKYLDTTVNSIKNDLQKISDENEELKHELVSYQSEAHKLRKKVKDLKGTLQIVQKYQPIGYTNEAINTFHCNECNKVFVNSDYLKAHTLRRHSNADKENIDDNQLNTTPVHALYKAETDRLQMEIKELKEKLNNTEKYLQINENLNERQTSSKNNETEATQAQEYTRNIEKLQEQFEYLKEQIQLEMQLLKDHKNDQSKYDQIMQTIMSKLEEKNNVQEMHPLINEDKEIQVNIVSEKETELPQKVEKNVTKEGKKPEEVKVVTQDKLPQEKNNISSVEKVPDITKVKEEVRKDLQEMTRQSMAKLGEELNEKMTTTFDKLQDRFELFWGKLKEIEEASRKQENVAPKIEKQKSKPVETSSTESLIHPVSKKKTTDTVKVPQTPLKLTDDDDDDDSDTESSEQEMIRPTASMITFHRSDINSKKLIDELKTKVEAKKINDSANNKLPSNIIANKKIISKSVENIKETKPSPSNIALKKYVPNSPVKVSSQEEITNNTESETEDSSSEESESESESESDTSEAEIKTVRARSEDDIRRATERSLPKEVPEFSITDINELVSTRLKDLGLDSEWTKVSDGTPKEKSEVISQERNKTTKRIKSFLDIRSNLMDNLEYKLKGLKPKNAKSPSPTSFTSEQSPEPEESKTSKFKSIFSNMKNKARSIIKSDKPTARQIPKGPIYKLTIQNNSPEHTPKGKEIISATKANLINRNRNKKAEETSKPRNPILYETDTDNTEASETVIEEPKQHPMIARKLLRKSRSDSSMEVLELSDQSIDRNKIHQKTKQYNVPVAAARSVDSILEMKNELKMQLNKSDTRSDPKISSVESVTTIDSKTDNRPIKSLMGKSDHLTNSYNNLSSSNEDDISVESDAKVHKSVLKNPTASGSVKKKVIFDLHSDDKSNTEVKIKELEPKMNEVKEIKPNPIKKTIVQSNSNTIFKNEWNDSSSIDSSIFDLNKEQKKTSDKISTKAVINVSAVKHDDVSDFDISDLN